MYKKILIPLDLSEYSSKALIHAAQLANLSGAELVLLHTMHYVTVHTWDVPDGSRDDGRMIETEKKNADKFLSKKLEELNERGIKTSYALREGEDSAQEILDFVEEDDKIDMVVMMTHGRSGIKRFLMGSLAEEMLRRQCKVPILMITSKAAENFPCE